MNNLARAMAAKGLTDTGLARLVDKAQAQIWRLRTGNRPLTKAWAELLAPHLGLSPQALLFDDNEPLPAPPGATVHALREDGPPLPRPLQRLEWPEFSDDRLPVLGKAVGGSDGKFMFNGEPIEYVSRPPSLRNVTTAYCVYVDGESMEPRYFAGELVYVHTGRPPRAREFVVVELHPEQNGDPASGYVKQFQRWAGEYLILSQLNPVKEIKIAKARVKGLHPIVGSFSA
ncbi:XRE family transcriptional regulator [Methylovirgula sp. 4M-Z18]|nr:XRE family transcriptional regulator [Methylovirgula sp. 4M-Z18]